MITLMEADDERGYRFRNTEDGGGFLATAIEAIFECRRRQGPGADVSNVRVARTYPYWGHEREIEASD